MNEGRILGINHIGISVSDMDNAICFFRDVLGATVTPPQEQSGDFLERATGITGARNIVCHAAIGPHVFELLHYTAPEERRTSDLRPCDAGHIHLAITVEGIDAVVERMRCANFEPVGPIERNIGSLGLAAIYTCGFDRLVVELIDYGKRPPG